jgi:hypothetical protein
MSVIDGKISSPPGFVNSGYLVLTSSTFALLLDDHSARLSARLYLAGLTALNIFLDARRAT